jgi:hypothetical protein
MKEWCHTYIPPYMHPRLSSPQTPPQLLANLLQYLLTMIIHNTNLVRNTEQQILVFQIWGPNDPLGPHTGQSGLYLIYSKRPINSGEKQFQSTITIKRSDCRICTPRWPPAQTPPDAAIFPHILYHGNEAAGGGKWSCRGVTSQKWRHSRRQMRFWRE